MMNFLIKHFWLLSSFSFCVLLTYKLWGITIIISCVSYLQFFILNFNKLHKQWNIIIFFFNIIITYRYLSLSFNFFFFLHNYKVCPTINVILITTFLCINVVYHVSLFIIVNHLCFFSKCILFNYTLFITLFLSYKHITKSINDIKYFELWS